MSSSKKKFKDYYQDDEYKSKHLDKMRQIVTCECGHEIKRYQLTRHLASMTHFKRMMLVELRLLKRKIVVMTKEIEKLEE